MSPPRSTGAVLAPVPHRRRQQTGPHHASPMSSTHHGQETPRHRSKTTASAAIIGPGCAYSSISTQQPAAPQDHHAPLAAEPSTSPPETLAVRDPRRSRRAGSQPVTDRRPRDLTRWCHVWGPWLAALLTILVGVGCSLGLYFWFRSVETGTFERDFASIRRICVRSLESVMAFRCFQHLRNFAAFTYSTPELTQAALTTFGERSSFDPKIIYSISLSVVVPKNQSAAASKFYHQTVWDSANAASFTRNDNVSVYPVLIHPKIRGSNYLGWNLLSDPIRRQPVQRALTPGGWGTSTPIAFRDSGEPGFGAWHYVPSRTPTPTTPFPNWVATISLSFSLLFTSTLDRLFKSANESDIAVFVDYENHERVFAYEPAQGLALLDPSRAAMDHFQGFNANWSVTFVPTAEYVSKFFTAVPWVVFACTLGVFVLLSDVVRRATARLMVSKQMLQRLQLQTQLLGSMQQYSRAVLEAIPDGLLMLDVSCRVMSANDAALKMTGYHLDDFVQPVPFTKLLEEPSPVADGQGPTCSLHGNQCSQRHRAPTSSESMVGSSVSTSASSSPASSCPATPSRPATLSSNGRSRSSRLRRRRNRTLDPTLAAPSNSPCPLAFSASASTTSIQIERDTPSVSPPSISRQASIHSSCAPSASAQDSLITLLEPGDHEVRMRRKDGSTFIAQLSVSEVNDPHVDPDAPIGDLLSLHHRIRTLSTHPPTTPSPDPTIPSSIPDHDLLMRDTDTSSATSTAHVATFHQIVLFHDITPRVEAMHLVAAMEKQATDATEAKQQLLRFLIQAMTVPVHQMMQDLDVIARAAEDRMGAGPGGEDADLADAKAAAKHISNVLDDVAVYAGVNCLDLQQQVEEQQQHQASSQNACGFDAGQACPQCGGCGSQGKLLRELVDGCIPPDMLATMRAQGIVLTVSVGRASGERRMPPGFACVACKLIHKFVALATVVARPAALMTLAINIDEPEAGTGDDPAMQFLVTLSAFDAQFPTTTVSHDLNLAVGSRGSTFGNVALTWAAVIQLVERNGGHIHQSRVTPGTGLVVSVTLPVPLSRS